MPEQTAAPASAIESADNTHWCLLEMSYRRAWSRRLCSFCAGTRSFVQRQACAAQRPCEWCKECTKLKSDSALGVGERL